jgi:RNA 3'-terminal phosphate cyclase (ATP)
VIDIDGAHGEGGGQIVRTAVSLAAATGRACRVFNIRARREKPGLMRQHLACVRMLADLSGAEVEGDVLRSREILFSPRPVKVDQLSFRSETAAALTLMLQAVIPAALSAPRPVTITLIGGATDTPKAPTLDYFRYVFLRHLTAAGVDTTCTLTKRGYYPPGEGTVELTVMPGKPANFDLSRRGQLLRITIFSSASEFLRNRNVAERQANAAAELISPLGVEIVKNVDYCPSLSPGCACCVVAEFDDSLLGADQIGAARVRAEEVGAGAARELIREIHSGAGVDVHLTDQILPYLALAGGTSRVSAAQLTRHALTNMWVIEHFLDGRFEVDGKLIRWRATG